MKIRRIHLFLGILIFLLALLPFREQIRRHATPLLRGYHTVDGRMRQYGPRVRQRWAPFFSQSGMIYPPARVTLLALKDEKTLQVYAAGRDDALRFIRAYPILGLNGTLGPKQREGDLQVPEGVYAVESLNPNSAYHLALRVNYPNAFDRAMADRDQRTSLGSDIMIHGGRDSLGCLAMGDTAIEDLFVLAQDTGPDHVNIVISPIDFRAIPSPTGLPQRPAWIGQLYAQIRRELRELPIPQKR